MAAESAELKLRAAISILEETSADTTDVSWVMNARERATSAGSFMSMWQTGAVEGVRTVWQEERRLTGAIQSLRSQIDHALALADESEHMDPGVTVEVTIEGVDGDLEYSPASVKSNAWYQQGMLSLGANLLDNAGDCFTKSLALYPNTMAQLMLAYTITGHGDRDEAIMAFEKVIQMDPQGEEAVLATRELSELRAIQPKKKSTALMLSIFAGFWGIDRFYLGDFGAGAKKLLTAGGFGVWWVLDILRIASDRMRDRYGMKLE